MTLFEYEGKSILKKYQLPILNSFVVEKPIEAKKAAQQLQTKVIIKAQTKTGKRGKRGLIKRAASPEEAQQIATEIFARSDIPEAPITHLLIEPVMNIAEEYYVAVMVDRSSRKIMVMLSPQGGVNIEEVVQQTPEAIEKIYLNFTNSVFPHKFFPMLSQFGIEGNKKLVLAEILYKLVECARSEDLLLVEINPLIFTPKGEAWLLDAKIQIDESALFRHPEQTAFLSLNNQLEAIEKQARMADITYVQLNGDIGTISCGAGLSMTTCDVIEKLGGKPANFLDVGGGASPDKIKAAMNLLFAQSHIRGILINIFGGITRCDQVAKGIISSIKNNPNHVPIVVRLIGTKDKEGIALLASEKIDAFTDMEPAIKRILEVHG